MLSKLPHLTHLAVLCSPLLSVTSQFWSIHHLAGRACREDLAESITGNHRRKWQTESHHTHSHIHTWQGRVQLWVCVAKACLCLREKWSDKVVLLSTNHLCLFCWTPTNSLSVVCPELETSLVCNSNTLRHCWLRLCWATTCQPAWSCRPSPHWTDLTPGGGSLGRSP